MLKNIRSVIFDLDGTLVDSMWLWHDIDLAYLGKFGLQVPQGLSAQIEGMSFSETAVYFKERFSIPDPVEKIKEEWNRMAWDLYTHRVPLKKGAAEFIKHCRGKGIKLAIATSNSRELAENVIGVHGLLEDFTEIVTGCDVEKGKPAPDVYLEAARKCGIPPQRCLVFEDIIPGILAGRAAGMKVCAVEDTYSLDQEEEKRRLSDYYVKDYFEVMAILGLPERID